MADTDTGADDQKDIDAEKGAADTENKGTDDSASGDDAADEGGDGKGAGADDKAPADDGAEPEARKRPVDYIIERKDRKIAKLEKGGKGDDDKSGEGAGEGDEDDVASEDAEIVRKTVMPMIEPILKNQAAQADAAELSTFLTERPEFKPYEAKIKRYMDSPARAGVPVKAIAYEVAGDDLLKIGAKKAKAADDKAKGTQTGGGSARESGSGAKDVWAMTPKEFEAEQQRIRTARRQ